MGLWRFGNSVLYRRFHCKTVVHIAPNPRDKKISEKWIQNAWFDHKMSEICNSVLWRQSNIDRILAFLASEATSLGGSLIWQNCVVPGSLYVLHQIKCWPSMQFNQTWAIIKLLLARTCGNSTACVCYLNWKPVDPPPPPPPPPRPRAINTLRL